MTTLRRSFGTDALNAGTPLTSPTSSSHSSSSSSMSAFSKPDAPLSAGGPRSASAMLGSWATSSSSSSSSGRRSARPSGLGDRLMGIDRGKRDSDRTWLREMEAQQQQQQQEQSAAKAAPVCRYYITHGHCVYGDACGFDHPPSLEGLTDEPPALISSTARRITVPVVPRPLVAPSTPPSRRVSEADIGLGLPLTPSRAVNRKRERDLSPLKHALPQPARDVRRPSLVATTSAPAVLPPPQPAGLTQPAATVAKPNHPDAPPAVPVLPPMFYATYRRGSNGEVLDPSLIPHGVQLQKSLYYRTKPCRYWAADGSCPKGDKCTFIHDPALGAATPDRASSSTPVQTVSIVEEPVVVVEEPVKVDKVPKTKLRLPPMPPTSPSKAREPHPAWRVVGGGVTLANARTEDQMDEDAVEQELLGNVEPASPVVSTPAYEAIPQTGVHAHNGFPAYALPTHPVYAAYAYPTPAPPAASPVAYQAPSPAPQVVYHAAPPAAPSPVAYQAPSPVAYQGAPVPEPGWAGWTMAVPAPAAEGQVPYYAAVPMYGPPGVVYVPPGHQVQVAPAPEQRPFLAGVAPQPVLYGTTPSSVTYGVPLHDGRTVEVLAESGIDVSRLDGHHEETFGELDGYGVTSHADAFGAHDDDEMEVELEVNMGVIGQGMISSVAPAPAPLKAKWSWADEVEEADPQWSPTPVQPEAEGDYQHQCATTPNSPRLRGRLFNAESP